MADRQEALKMGMDQFHTDMAEANITPLWERGLWPDIAAEPLHIWRWEAIETLIEPAIKATSLETAARRAFILGNPAYAAIAWGPTTFSLCRTGSGSATKPGARRPYWPENRPRHFDRLGVLRDEEK